MEGRTPDGRPPPEEEAPPRGDQRRGDGAPALQAPRVTVQQFQDARRTCKDGGIEHVISNPRFEVWLLDHLARCPDSHSETKNVERKAADLRIVGGSRDKHINYDKIEGARDSARKNTSGHNTEERGRRRAQLNSLDFGS